MADRTPLTPDQRDAALLNPSAILGRAEPALDNANVLDNGTRHVGVTTVAGHAAREVVLEVLRELYNPHGWGVELSEDCKTYVFSRAG